MVQPFVGRDPATGERILAASGPMIFSNGDVVGVLRFVTSTRLVDRQIMLVVLTSSLVLMMVMAVVASGPMIFSNGDVVGVLRFVTSTRLVDRQIMLVVLTSSLVLMMVMAVVLVSSNYYLHSIMNPVEQITTSTRLVDRQIMLVVLTSSLVLMMVMAVVLVSSNYYLHSIMNPVEQITEKAKRIANGSYGVQIKTPYKDEIGELADTINEMSNKIAQNEKMQVEFISQLSHELRTPLTVINGWSETLLADENMDADTRQGMKIIASEAKRLTEMVVDLLDFTRMQDGRMTLAVEMTDLRGEFEDTVYMYGSRLSQDGIKLH